MSLDHAILGFLSRGPMSGYDLKTRCFDREAADLWTADQAQVYRTLDRLARDRKLTVKRIRQRGKPDRKVFSITAEGRRALDDWLSSAEEPSPVRDPFLLKLLFADALVDEDLLRVLDEERDAYQQRLRTLRLALADSSPRAASDDRTTAVRRMAIEGVIAPTRAAIDWLDHARDRVREGLPEVRREDGCTAGHDR